MSEAQGTKTPGRPWHLWLLGIIGVLWSAIGVFGGVIGCVLLLLKRRLAFPVLLASIVGAIVCNLGGLFFLGGMAVMGGASASGFAAFISIVAVLLAYYARAMHKKGVLS